MVIAKLLGSHIAGYIRQYRVNAEHTLGESIVKSNMYMRSTQPKNFAL
jgi:hypothetical protein